MTRKKIMVKKLLILIMAMCSLVGIDSVASTIVPRWFGNNMVFTGQGLFMPRPTANTPLWMQVLNSNNTSPNNNIPFVAPQTPTLSSVRGGGNSGSGVTPVAMDVKILENGLTPLTVNSSVGSKVTWTNKTSEPLRIKALSGGTFSTIADIPVNESYSFTFNTVGNWKYQVFGSTVSLEGVINISSPASTTPVRGGNSGGTITTMSQGTIFLTDNGPFPSLITKPLGATIAWRNASNRNTYTITPTGTSPSGLNAFTVPVAGTFMYTFTASGTTRYVVTDQNGTVVGAEAAVVIQ